MLQIAGIAVIARNRRNREYSFRAPPRLHSLKETDGGQRRKRFVATDLLAVAVSAVFLFFRVNSAANGA